MGNGTGVKVEHLFKGFGEVAAVDDVSFEVPDGKILTLLGPSGCGKTTTLRCIAGLEIPDKGTISIAGEVVARPEQGLNLPPEKRGLGMVFQSYAIWPHMTVFDNIAYPLKVRGAPRDLIKKRVLEILGLVGLEGMEGRLATKLSGGQQQRVAVARALVASPRLLLFDEPLSNLDAKLRERMRVELVRVQREVGITSVYVTHDQAEAMAISDEIIVMNRGKIVQRGDARSLYFAPANRFVADFIGVANFLEGTVADPPDRSGMAEVLIDEGAERRLLRCQIRSHVETGARLAVSVRPEMIRLLQASGTEPGGNRVRGRVTSLMFLGDHTDCRVAVGSKELRIKATGTVEAGLGDDVSLEMDPQDCIAIPVSDREI